MNGIGKKLNVLFEYFRNKSGVWGMRSEKTETINGYECKVYTANNVELVTRTRIEHMSADDRKAYEATQGAKRNILGGVMNFLESSATSRSTTSEASGTSSPKASSNVCRKEFSSWKRFHFILFKGTIEKFQLSTSHYGRIF